MKSNNHKSLLMLLVFGICFLFFVSLANGATVCVSSSSDLQNVLTTSASNGEDDVIHIVQGSYYGNFVYASTELHGVTIEGGYTVNCTSRMVNPDNTVLDAGGSGPVLVLSSPDVKADFAADGLTLQNGNAYHYRGGGLHAQSGRGNVTLTNSIFKQNMAISDHGGGIHISGVNTVTVANSIISNNNTFQGAGAGIHIFDSSSIILTNNKVSNNGRSTNPGSGAGIYVQVGDTGGITAVSLINNTISHNVGTDGGGLYFFRCTVNLEGNVINNNIAEGDGGGVFVSLGSVKMTNNVIVNNSANSDGGAFFVWGAKPISLVNNTMTDNFARGKGGSICVILYADSDAATTYNNIVWNNDAGEYGKDIYIDNDGDQNHIRSMVSLYNNDFDQSPAGTYIQIPFPIDPSNLDNVDPLVVDPVNGDFHLQAASPCINVGDNLAPGLPATDKDGLPRIVISVVDKGAYEYQEVIEVDIDIKPGSSPNSINLGSKGVVAVAMLTTEDFDTITVDPATVLFAGASPLWWAMDDVDGDGDMDLLFHFKTQELNLIEGDTEATLTGTTFDGQPIEGMDLVNIVSQK